MEHLDKLSPEKQASILQSAIAEFSQKPFAYANTDVITRNAGISKGLLFHYFGSKKAVYLYALRVALDRLTAATPDPESGGFYEQLFFVMDEKLRLCRDYPAETLFVNMAARDDSEEVSKEKLELFSRYLAGTTRTSQEVLMYAIATLPLKNPDDPTLLDALTLYIHAINQKFLLAYREKPEAFFANAEQIKREMKAYIDYMLNGVAIKEI